MHENEVFHIFDLNGYGQGVARSKDGKIVFIVDGLPGDSVTIKIIEEQKRYLTATVKETLKRSEWREEPSCSHTSVCGGCQLQGIQSGHYMKAKQSILRAKLRGILAPFREQTITESPLFSFRNKCTLEWSAERKILSYADLKNNQFKLKQCIVLERQISNWINNHKNITSQLPMSGRITIKNLPDQGLVLGIKSKQTPTNLKLPEPFIAAYWIDYNKVESQGSFQWVTPPKYTLVEKIDKLVIPWHPQSFFQTNRYIAGKIFSSIKKWIIDLKISSVWDLYCGTGWILHSIKDSLKFGVGFELSQHSVNIARTVPNSPNVKFINADLPNIPQLSSAEPDCWIFNPPRKGLGKKVIQTIFNQQSTPKCLMYLSCNPESLSTDLQALSKYGFKPEECQVFDMFPWTSHFEVLCLLRKSN